MAFFGLFNNKKNENDSNIIPLQLSPNNEKTSLEEVMNEAPVIEKSSPENKPLTVSCATGWPIDIIYGYLHKNYENKGYDDAMLNSNLAFRDMNMNIIRHKILMVFREIKLNYDAMKQDLEVRIQSCNAVGLLTTVADLNIQMTVINSHMEELEKLENDFRNNANEASVPLMSYECGFLRGVSTIAMVGSNRTQPAKAPFPPTFNAQSAAV